MMDSVGWPTHRRCKKFHILSAFFKYEKVQEFYPCLFFSGYYYQIRSEGVRGEGWVGVWVGLFAHFGNRLAPLIFVKKLEALS